MTSHASMNRIYRLVFNAALGIWVAVAENAKGRGKGGRAASALIAVLAILSPAAYAANAADATLRGGAGSVATAGNTTTINQTSQRLALDWTQLSTTANEALIFSQPNAQAIALNRITGSSPSSFLGSLSANGQVFILNPNGVLFGAGSQVNVGGLVASTLSISNADFMAGSTTFSKTTGTGSVVNQGTITAASGGYIALLAPEVRNEGVMTARLGTALLAAGNKVTLNLDNGSLLGYSIDQGAINALAENKQLIKADGGQVLLGAKALDSLTTATVNNTGIIEAHTLQNKAGRILLIGDMQYGTVNVGGTLDASAPNGGDGGFIETSAANFTLAPDLKIKALAPQGKDGKWLLDPTQVTIAGGTGGAANTIYEDTIEAAGSDVAILASDTIFVTGTFSNADVALASGRNLTIVTNAAGGGTGIDLTSSAHGADLTFKTAGGGSVNIRTGNAGQTLKTSAISVTGGGSITLESLGPLDISNTTLQTAGGAITLSGNGSSGADGVKISKGIVNAGTGALTITGSTTSASFGVNIENALGASTLTGGTVSITGSTTGGNYGVRIDRSTVSASNGLTLDSATADSRMYLQGATLDATGGNILIKAKGASTNTSPELTNALFIGDVSGTSTRIRNTGIGNITIEAELTSHAVSTGSPNALLVRNSQITTNAGSISLTGATGTSGNVDGTTGVMLASGAIVTGASNVSITGTAGATASNGSAGTFIANTAQVTSSGGNVTVNGTFNNPASLTGLGVRIAGKVAAPSGTVAITGSATVGGASGTGVQIDPGADISAGLGVTITSAISSATTATNIVAMSMQGGTVTSAGNIVMTGTVAAPSAANAKGLDLAGGTMSATGAATISLTGSGVPASAPASSYALNISGTTVNSAGGQINLAGDRVAINSTVNAGAGRVVITPTSTNRQITLGGIGETAALNLSASELNRITAGTLIIGGGAFVGGIDIGSTNGIINPVNVSSLSLINSSASGAGITQSAAFTVANLNADAALVNLSMAGNQISQISGRAGIGNFDVRSASALSVGTVDGRAGITGNGAVTLASGGALTQTQAIVSPSALTASSTGGMTLDHASNQIGIFGTIQNSGSGDIVLRNSTGTVFSGVANGGGRIDISNTGNVTLNSAIISSSGANAGGTAATAAISLVATGRISAGVGGGVTNSGGGSVYLQAGNGDIGLNSANAVAVSTSGAVTAVAAGGSSQINLAVAGGATVENVSAPGAVNVSAAAGNLAVKVVSGSAVTLSAVAGAILDANGATNNITAGSLNATAGNGITLGTNVTGLQTLATTGATGDISITAGNALATSNLSVSTNGGTAQTVSLNSAAGITVDSAFGNAQDNFKLTATGGNLNVNAALTANKLTLSTAGTSAQTAAITASGLELLGTGSHTLNNAGNAVMTLAGNTGNAAYSQAGALTIGTVNSAGLAASGKVLVRTTGAARDLTVANAVSAASTANDALVLAAGRNFINSSGSATPLTTGSGGRYLVYSADPAANSLGSMVSPGNAFNRTFAGNAPADTSMTSIAGNRLVYSMQPTLNVSGNSQSKTSGGVDPVLTYTVNSGLVAGDTAATALSGALSAPTGAATTGPTHAITLGTLASALGYNIAYTNGTLTVTNEPTPAPLPAPAPSSGVTADTPQFIGALQGVYQARLDAGGSAGANGNNQRIDSLAKLNTAAEEEE